MVESRLLRIAGARPASGGRASRLRCPARCRARDRVGRARAWRPSPLDRFAAPGPDLRGGRGARDCRRPVRLSLGAVAQGAEAPADRTPAMEYGRSYGLREHRCRVAPARPVGAALWPDRDRLAVQDGYRDTPDPFATGITAAEAGARYAIYRRRTAFGSRVLFNPNLSLGARIDDRWAIEAAFEHFSHGKVFSSQNPGIDTIGLRLVRRLGR